MNAPFLRPRGCPLGVDPFEWRQEVEARIEQLQDAMLSLIDALDTMDGDTDLEPSLAGFDGVNVPTDDREGGDVLDEGEPNDWDDEDSDADEDAGDDGSSMGWATPTGGMSVPPQEGWGYHAFGAGADQDD